jgi:hypothetical protein
MYEVYAYWNVAELEAMFNAVASLMGSGDYRGLLRTMAMVGIVVVVIATLTGRENASTACGSGSSSWRSSRRCCWCPR